MVVDKDNTIQKVSVSLGARVGDRVELVQGPPPGTSVLAVGTAYVLDGDVIHPVASDDVPAAAGAPASAPELAGKPSQSPSQNN